MSFSHAPHSRLGLLASFGLLTSVLCALLCGARAAKAVVGGYRPDPNQWPWLVSVERHPAGPGHGSTSLRAASFRTRQKCGGTLIDPWVVLTAAHCVVGSDGRHLAASKLSVVAGADDLTNGQGHEVMVGKVTAYPGFSRRHPQGDIALLRLVRPQPEQSAIFMNTKTVIYEGDMLTAMGWGAMGVTASGRLVLPAQRLAVDLPIWTDQSCAQHHVPGIGYDPATMLCAGYAGGGHDTCYGDSGSPLMMWRDDQWQLVGVVSYGNGCGRPDSPGFYAWVSSPRLYGWIRRAATQLIY